MEHAINLRRDALINLDRELTTHHEASAPVDWFRRFAAGHMDRHAADLLDAILGGDFNANVNILLSQKEEAKCAAAETATINLTNITHDTAKVFILGCKRIVLITAMFSRGPPEGQGGSPAHLTITATVTDASKIA